MECDRELRNSTMQSPPVPTCSPLDERIGWGPVERRRKEHDRDCMCCGRLIFMARGGGKSKKGKSGVGRAGAGPLLRT